MDENQKKEYLSYLQKDHGLTSEQASEYLAYTQQQNSPSEDAVEYKKDMSADIPMKQRFVAKNFAGSPEAQVGYLSKELPEKEFTVKDGDVFARDKGTKNNYAAIDPSGFDMQDITDIAYDVGAGGLQGLATTAAAAAGSAAGGVGAIPAGIAAGAASGAGLEGLRQLIGSKLGIENNLNAKEIAVQGAAGAAGPVMERVAKPVTSLVSKGLSKIGSAQFKSAPGLMKADALAEEYAKIAPSEVIEKYGISGSAKKISKKTDELVRMLSTERDAILKEASKAGVKTDPGKATQRGLDFLMSTDNPNVYGATEAVDEMLPELAKFELKGAVSPEEITKSAKRLYDKAGDQAMKAMGNSEESARFFRQLGLGARDAAKDAVSTWDAKKGSKLSELNEELASLLTTRKALQKEGAKVGPSLFSSIDGIIVGMGNPAVMATKKSADLAKTTWFKTKSGSAIKEAGKLAEKSSPWVGIYSTKYGADKLKEGE